MNFPNVPDLPGVPPIPRLPGAVYNTITLGSEAISGVLWGAAQNNAVWGVYDSNSNLVIQPDSILNLANENEWSVCDFPVQDGSFASYNIVIHPFEVSLRMTKGGTTAERAAFLAQIAAIAGTTNLYTIISPEWSYQNCVLRSYSNVRRGPAGAYFLAEVDVHFRQVIQVSEVYTNTVTNTTNATDPTAQPIVNLGSVNPQPISAQQINQSMQAISFE